MPSPPRSCRLRIRSRFSQSEKSGNAWDPFTHFLIKGLAKVQCEWSLTTLAYNLKRVLNLVRFRELMAAVG